MRNGYVRKTGGWCNRSGTYFIYGAQPFQLPGPYDDAGPPIGAGTVLIPWEAQDSTSSFALEFGNGFIRFTKAGALVTVDVVADWDNAASYAIGDLANYQGTNYYCILAHSGHQPANVTYWYQLNGYEYSIPTPYTTAFLSDRGQFRFCQDADRMLITHGSLLPMELVRVTDTKWTLTAWPIDASAPTRYGLPRLNAPTGLAAVTASTQPVTLYGVTALTDDLEESLPATVASPLAAASPGNVALSWNASTFRTGATGTIKGYRIYRQEQGVLFYLGWTTGTSFTDDATITPSSTGASPPESRVDLNSTPGTFPRVCGVYEDRTLLGNFSFNVQAFYAARVGFRQNFTKSFPSAKDDSILSQCRGKRPQGIRHFVDIGTLLILCDNGEFIVEGDPTVGGLSPTGCFPRQYGYNGAAKSVPPVVIGSRAVYVQEQGSLLRAVSFNPIYGGRAGYIDEEISAFAEHLVLGHTIVSMAYQKTPHSILWLVREDGVLVSVTYIPDQKILAFAHHDTDGFVEDVCTIQEGADYAVYLIVRRTVNAITVRYMERMVEREFADVQDAVLMDCALSWDFRNTDLTKTLTLTGGVNWDETETLLVTSKVPMFSQLEVDRGNELWFNGADGVKYRCKMIEWDGSDLQITVRPVQAIPVASGLQGVATSNWERAVTTLLNLDHIEGKKVSILANGYVVSSPNNAKYPTLTVTLGTVVMPEAYSYGHVGLPFIADLETLDIDTANGESLVDKAKNVQAVTVDYENTRGVWIGPQAPDSDTVDPLQRLTEVKMREGENYGTPIALNSGTVETLIESHWNSNGRVFLRQVDPLPVTVLAITPQGFMPFKGGA